MNNSTAYAALILRISLGTMFIAHSLLKIMVFTPAGTAGYFSSIGLPAWLAYVTIAFELIGGILLIAGYKTKIVSIALTPILMGSIIFAHGAKGWVFSNEGGGWEYSLFLILACVVQFLLGNGAFSIQGKSKQAVTV